MNNNMLLHRNRKIKELKERINFLSPSAVFVNDMCVVYDDTYTFAIPMCKLEFDLKFPGHGEEEENVSLETLKGLPDGEMFNVKDLKLSSKHETLEFHGYSYPMETLIKIKDFLLNDVKKSIVSFSDDGDLRIETDMYAFLIFKKA